MSVTTSSAVAAPSSGILFAPELPKPLDTRDIVAVRLHNDGTTTEQSGYVTFGQVFASGAVRPTGNLVARLNGVEYAVQMDVKALHDDGSVRHAILTLQAPTLAAGGAVDVMLANGSTTAANAAPNIATLLSSGYDTSVALTFHNPDGSTVTDSASAAAALQAALSAGTVQNWLAGPNVNEYIVSTTVNGGKLKVEFDIRAYADGTTTTDVIFDNSWMFSPSKSDLNYDVSISQAGTEVYSFDGVSQYLYSMWHYQVDSAGRISPSVQFDTSNLLAAGALPNYDLSYGISDAAVQANYSKLDPSKSSGSGSTGPMGTALVTTYMPTTGGRADIGPQSAWTAQWLTSQDPTARAVMMANADASGGIPWHFTDESTGKPLNGHTYPTFWEDPRHTGLPQPANPWPTYGQNGNVWSADTAHAPDLNYVPYLVTGSHYQLTLLQHQADYMYLALNPYYRYSRPGVDPHNPGDAIYMGVATPHNQQRAIAWSIRELAEAAYITPDSDPLKSYFTSELNATLSGMVEYYINRGATAPFGEFEGFVFGAGGHQIAPWQQDLIVTALAGVAEMDIPGASQNAIQMLEYMGNFVAGLYTNEESGYNPLNGPAYYLNVSDPQTGTPYTTWAELQQANVDAGELPSNPTTLPGSPQSASGYVAYAKAALADLITYTQSPQAIEAYGYLVSQIAYAWQGRDQDGIWQADPTWSISPRLPDGIYLESANIQVDISGANNVMLQAAADDSLLAVVGTGTATLRGGTGTCDLLFGGGGPTTLIAGTGDDYLYAGSGPTIFIDNIGDNYMHAGSGPDTFTFNDVYDMHSGHDTIADFNPITDVLHIDGADLGNYGITTVDQLLAGATVVNGNTVLHFGPYDDITMVGIGVPTDLLQSIDLVNVADQNDTAPVINTPAIISIAENTTTVTALTSTDTDTVGINPAIFTIIGGDDAAKFIIDNGNLLFLASADFENPTDAGHDNAYILQVQASDGVNTANSTITINVTDVFEPPSNAAPTITSDGGGDTATLYRSENNSAVTTVVASDPDIGNLLSYSIIGGADQSRFQINQTTGALSFITAPILEEPTDTDVNNSYIVEVQAADNGNPSLTDTQLITINVTDIPEPLFTDGNDTVQLPGSGGTWVALGGNDTVFGTSGLDMVYGGDGNDWLDGNAGNDLLEGETGDDVLIGGDGDDQMYAGGGLDWLYGYNGNDILIGGPDFNVLQGGGGNDYLYLYYAGGLSYGDDGNDVLVGNLVVDVLIGGNGDDTFYGYGGNDYFYGEGGNDVMFGGEGVDVLIGGDGNDYFDGGPGVNYYYGGDGGGPGTGRGNNTFNVTFDEINVIQDWTGALDRILLNGSGFRSFEDVASHSYQNGAYLVVQLNPSTAVWINGANAGSVNAANFIIVS